MHLIVHIAVGSLVIAVSIPLILRRVPMNRFYGVRIPQSFESDEAWYDINAYGGKLLVVYGILLILYGIFARPYAPSAQSLWSLVYVIGPLLLVLPLLAMIVRYANARPRSRR